MLIGPFSLALLGRPQDDGVGVLGATLDGIVAVYGEVIARLAAAGAEWIQLDEPCLVQDRTADELAALQRAYVALAAHKGDAKLLVQTYFGFIGESYATLAQLPIDGIGLDFVRAPHHLELLRQQGFPADKTLSVGIVNGRNVWRTDLAAALATAQAVAEIVPACGSSSRPRARCCTCPMTRPAKKIWMTNCAAGWASPCKSCKNWSR